MSSVPHGAHRGGRQAPKRCESRGRGRLSKLWRRIAPAPVVSAILALLWLLLRSGSRPSRLAYPCQQAAFSASAAVFGAPLVAAIVGARLRIHRSLRNRAVRLAAAGGVVLLLAVLAARGIQEDDPVAILAPPPEYRPDIYLVNDARGPEPGRHGGVDDLIGLMGMNGLKWHRSASAGRTSGPDGLIGVDDLVLIKINAQWSQCGGTNTDVLKGVLRSIVEHPDGFTGEIVVADNGQGYGSLDPPGANAENRLQTTKNVVAEFADEGWSISAMLWDAFNRRDAVGEYSSCEERCAAHAEEVLTRCREEGGALDLCEQRAAAAELECEEDECAEPPFRPAPDMNDGYVLNPSEDPDTEITVSYPKFRTSRGTYVSYKYGIWSEASRTYDASRFKVINIPVLKTHFIYGITACVKNHMGVVTRDLGTDSHNAIGRGGLGSFLAEVRMPDMNILDCIYVLARPGSGPPAPYGDATRRDQLAASRDPVALDAWATRYILVPQFIENGYSQNDYRTYQDPDNPNSVFRRYLDLSMNELLSAGISATSDYEAVDLHVWPDDVPGASFVRGDANRDDQVDISDPITVLVAKFLGTMAILCEDAADANDDGDVDVSDAVFSLSYLFLGGRTPSAPFPNPGPDPSLDGIGCEQ